MLFNSYDFLIFLPVAFGVHFALPQRWRALWLLACSYYFYMCWRVEYAALLALSTIVDYFCALLMANATSRYRKRAFLILSLTVNLGLLFTFKYLGFFLHSIKTLTDASGFSADIPILNLLLPVGISFYTFQSLSYTIDVYRGAVPPERSLVRFALYVSFFPQLVAGPIERSSHLLPQFQNPTRLSVNQLESGCKLILLGFFKKLVIADRLALYVNPVYAQPDEYTGSTLLLATYFFAFQIYCDFSGYSDIAVGTAQLFGYDLRLNFHQPYFATNIQDFWRRWHVTLSTWFRDYLYLPLGGNQKGTGRTAINLMTVFCVSGLWHGANWTFVTWGAIHGLLLVGYLFYRQAIPQSSEARDRAPSSAVRRLAAGILTFHLVLLTWVFFRAQDISSAVGIVKRVLSADCLCMPALHVPGVSARQSIVGIVAVLALLAFEKWGGVDFRSGFNGKPTAYRWAVLYILMLSIVNFGMFHGAQEFIYFQF
ncbi:MAG TPA: MBOAT family protein [Pirellulales bacterium]|nr:MBOAT family protein [Pirellulales bacterium]